MELVESRRIVEVSPSGEVAFFHNGDRAEMRVAILELKDALMHGETREFEVEHIVCDGTYTRKLFIPKGSVLVGQIHKKDCVNIIAKGDISILTEVGAGRVRAGDTAVSPAGLMKVGYAHEDTVFLNVFRTDKTVISEIEQEIASKDVSDLIAIEGEDQCLLLG